MEYNYEVSHIFNIKGKVLLNFRKSATTIRIHGEQELFHKINREKSISVYDDLILINYIKIALDTKSNAILHNVIFTLYKDDKTYIYTYNYNYNYNIEIDNYEYEPYITKYEYINNTFIRLGKTFGDMFSTLHNAKINSVGYVYHKGQYDYNITSLSNETTLNIKII